MKTLIKVVLVILLFILLAAGIGLYFLAKNLDGIVRNGTERALEYVLQVDVSVGGASVDVRSGAIEFTDILISNPDGYNSDHAMAFGLVRAEADIASFRTDKPIVRLIRLSQSDIVLEKKGTSSNLQDLMRNAQRLASGEGKEPPPSEDEAAGKKMVIEKLLIDGTTVGVQVPLLEQTYRVELPDVEKENIGGGDEEKVSPAEAMQEILAILLEQIREAGAGILPGDLLNSLQDSLRSLPADLRGRVGETTERLRGSVDSALEGLTSGSKDSVGDAVDSAGDTVKDVTEGIGETVEGAGEDAKEAVEGTVDDIKGLFGKKKSD